MSNRQSEIIKYRLNELRARVSHGNRNARFDKDLENITSDRADDIPLRTFFAGEIFWVERLGWPGCGGFYTNLKKKHHPGLVTCKNTAPYSPIEMIPGSTSETAKYWNQEHQNYFEPQDSIKPTTEREQPEQQFFVLDYQRPVARTHIEAHLGTLCFKDIQRLQQSLRKWTNQPRERH